MRYFFAFAAAFAIAVSAASAASGPTIVMPGQEKYAAQPGNYQMAVLYGDPSKAGLWVVRLKLPANWSFPAHYHAGRESVTVISGTFYAGIGRKLNRARASAFQAGSFVSIPPRLAHYAFTRGPAVIDITGTDPLTNIMLK